MTFFKIYHWRKKAIPFLISGLMISCSPLNPLGLASGEYTAIAELGQISNQSNVTLKGIVVNVAPFLEGGAYQLQDATGTVWVRTEKPLPPKGSSLAVKGELKYEAIFVGTQQLGESYLLELSQEPQTSLSSTDSPPTSTPPAQDVVVPSDRPPVSKPALLLPIQAETPPPIPASPVLEVSPPPTEPKDSVSSPPPKTEVQDTVSPPPAEVEVPTPTPSSQPIEVSSPSPSSPPKNKPEPNRVINPVVPASSKPTPTKTKPPDKINIDDQFLPHKRLQK
jgi:hypothetical protein